MISTIGKWVLVNKWSQKVGSRNMSVNWKQQEVSVAFVNNNLLVISYFRLWIELNRIYYLPWISYYKENYYIFGYNLVFFLKKFWRAQVRPFCGATNTPVLDFWWCLPLVPKPGWIPWLAYFVACVQRNPQIHLWCDTCWPLGGQHGN